MGGGINEKSNLIGGYDFLEKTFLLVLNAPMQTKMSIAAHVWCMTKTLRNAIMKRTELETKYLKNKTGIKIKLKEYKKQRDFCIVNFIIEPLRKKVLLDWRYDKPLSIYLRLVGMTI